MKRSSSTRGMNPELEQRGKGKSRVGRIKIGENLSSPDPRESRSVRLVATTIAVRNQSQQRPQQLQHSGIPVQHPIAAPPLGFHRQQFISGMVSTPKSKTCRPIAKTSARSARPPWGAEVRGETGSGIGNRVGNGAEALQIQQPHQSPMIQLPSQLQSLDARQTDSQSIALPSATARWQPQQPVNQHLPQQHQQQVAQQQTRQQRTLPQQTPQQQQEEEQREKTRRRRQERRERRRQQQQQPRTMNLAGGDDSAEENEEAIDYGRGCKEYRNGLLGGAQAQLGSSQPTQQQQPRAVNLAGGGNSAEENEEAIDYGRGFEKYRDGRLGGAQARGRGCGGSSGDRARIDKKRGRRQEPETSAFDRSKGAGRSGANIKRRKASRREAGEGERSRASCSPSPSPSHSASRTRRSIPDKANAPSAAAPESPEPSKSAASRQPRALSTDPVSPVASAAFRMGEAVRHQRTADSAGSPAAATGTASSTAAAASAALETPTAGVAAALHGGVRDNTLPGSTLHLHPFPRPSAAGEVTTAWASMPLPWRPAGMKSSNRGCSSTEEEANKQDSETDEGNSSVGEGEGAGARGDAYPSPTLAANSQAKPAPYSPLSLRRVAAAGGVVSGPTGLLRSDASAGSTLAQQLSLAAMEAKERALRLRREAARAQRQAAKAVRLANAEIMRAEACAQVESAVAAAAAAAASCAVAASSASGGKVYATADFPACAAGKELGDRGGNAERDVQKGEAGNYAVSDDSEPEVGEKMGDCEPSDDSDPADEDPCHSEAESPRFPEVLPPERAASTVERVSAHRGASRRPAKVNTASMKFGTSTPPGRYDVSSSEAATSDYGASPIAGDAGNAWNGGTPINEQVDGPVSSPPSVFANRFDVSSSEDTDSVRCASPRGAEIGNAGAGGTPTFGEGEGGRASFHTPVASGYDVSSSDEDENVDRSESVAEALAEGVKKVKESGFGEVDFQTSPRGRYDVSSSSSAATSDQEDSDSNDGNGSGSLAGLSAPGLTSPLSSQPLGRYDVSSSSSDGDDEGDTAASTTPAATPMSSPCPSGRYDVSSSSSDDGGGDGKPESTSGDEEEMQRKQQRQQRQRLKRQQKQRLRRHRRRAFFSASPPPPLTPPEVAQEPAQEQEQEQERDAPLELSEFSPSESRSGDGGGFDSDVYRRFYAPKFPGSGAGLKDGAGWGLGLPHPLGLEVGVPSSNSADCEEGRGGKELGSASSNDEVVRQPASPAVVVPSGAEFEWGKVDPESPLRLHKSLLDRLAGMGTPLPPLPGMPLLVGEPRSSPPPTAGGPASPTPMEEDGNPPQDPLKANSDKGQDRSKSTGKDRLNGGGASAPPSQQAVVDVDRESGNQHWGEIMNAANMPPIELDPAKRSRSDGGGGGVESKPSGGDGGDGGGGGGGGGGARSPPVEPPLPMRDDPDGSGEKVLDQVAHARMFPGGAVLSMKGLHLKDKSAVSAAFELCAAMVPKSRPKFEHKDGNKSNTSPFTLHVSVNGVNYTPATAKSVKLTKQLAAVNFLREAVGTRERIKLEELCTEAGGGATANAALAAAVGKSKGKTKAKEGEGEGDEDDGNEDVAVVNEAEAARLALDDGLPNHAQLLHDLAAAHPETPSFATYAYRSVKDPSSGSSSSGVSKANKTFRCTARIIKHGIDEVEAAQRREKEKDAKAAEDAARAALSADPTNQELLQEIEQARADIYEARTAPVLNIEMLNAVGDGASKKEAKHRAAEAMAYKLLPECKTDAELRKRIKKIIDVYQKEKRERVEEEQRIAHEAKALREKTKAAQAPEPHEPPKHGHFGRMLTKAVDAAKRRNASHDASAAEVAASAGAGASAVDNEPPGLGDARASAAAALFELSSAGDRGSRDTPPVAVGASAAGELAVLGSPASPDDSPACPDSSPGSGAAEAASAVEAASVASGSGA